MFEDLFEKLHLIDNISDKNLFVESWGILTFSGHYKSQNLSYFDDVYTALSSLKIQTAIHHFIRNTEKSLQEFKDELQQGDVWKLNINKYVLINSSTDDNKAYNFFYSLSKLKDWISGSNPFADDYPLNNKSFYIVANGLNENFGGYNFVVCNQECELDIQDNDWDNYDETLIENNIHTISKSRFIIKPLKHYLTFGKITDISRYFYRNSILVLLVSLSNEVYSNNEIILRGYRRIKIDLGENYLGNEISVDYQNNLANAVKWVYQKNDERCDLRLKLLLERITLDLDYFLPYIQGLFSIIKEATNQAQERYSFIIYDRKDLYHKELKDLLKDLKNLSELYSNKLRSLLSNLLRDVLAAFILVGITLFSKTTEIEKLFENKLIKYVFFAFGVYFIISALFQLITDSFDIYRSNKEFDYWKNVSRDYMSKQDFDTHKSQAIKGRAIGTIIIYVFIVICYIAVAILCFNFPHFWSIIN